MTRLDIWNQALALLPHDRRVASEGEGSLEAQRCAEHWDAARRAVLSAREWGWLVVETPPCRAHAGAFCPRPPGALAVLGLYDASGRRVAADAVNGGFRGREPYSAMRFLPDDDDPEGWPPAVADAVTAELAARIAPVMTDNPQRSAQLRQWAAARLEEAGRLDAMESAWGGGDPLALVRARG